MRKLQAKLNNLEKERNNNNNNNDNQQQQSSQHAPNDSGGAEGVLFLKSPARFLTSEHEGEVAQQQKEIARNNNNNNYNYSEYNNASYESNANDLTSFWLNSKHSLVNLESEQSKEQEEEDIDDSVEKNNEILQQIRKIMGDLQLSDAEEQEEEQVASTNETSDQMGFLKEKMSKTFSV